MNLDDILGKALRGGTPPNPGVYYEVIVRDYQNHDFKKVIDFSIDIGHEYWTEEIAIIFLKSYIHLYGENDPIIPDLLFLAVTKSPIISFRGLGTFKIDFTTSEVNLIIKERKIYREWLDKIICIEGEFQYVIKNTRELEKDFALIESTRDQICLFILSCLELYEMESDYYPLYKWLLNLHFKSHQH